MNSEPIQISRCFEFHALNLIVFTHSNKQSNDKHCGNATTKRQITDLIMEECGIVEGHNKKQKKFVLIGWILIFLSLSQCLHVNTRDFSSTPRGSTNSTVFHVNSKYGPFFTLFLH